jgi:hypothetical protein
MKLTYEALLSDPSLLERIRLDAHRERAEAIHRIVLAPLAALLVRRFKTFLSSHAARPHLARQG